jgi:hydroxypyruvate isomerase
MKFCPNLHFMYQEHSFLDRFEAAARDGFKAVEICFAYNVGLEAVRTALKDCGQTLVSFNFPAGDVVPGKTRGTACLPGSEAAFEEQIERGLDWAGSLDIPRGIAPLAGLVPETLDLDEAWTSYLGNIENCVPKLEKAGVTLLVEPHNTIEHPGYLVHLASHARRAVDHAGSARVRMLLDTFHSQMMEGDLTRRFLEHLDVIDHIQLGSVPGRHEPVNCEINHGFLIAQLEQAGYDGWIAGEYFPKADTSQGLGWVAKML